MTANSKLDTLTTKLNRLKAKKAALETRSKQHTQSDRLKRTRTLIQMGGLLSLVGIPDCFGIEVGDELQTDLEKKDQSMMLLGLLATVAEQMPKSFSEDRLTELKFKGMRFLSERAGYIKP